MKRTILSVAIVLMATLLQATEKPRIIVMTDGEIDDRCSMVHFLLCSSDFQVDAIIETGSQFQRDGWSIDPWLEEQINDYAKVYPNLLIHNPDYPSPEYLKSVCFVGDEDKSHLVQIVPSITYPGAEPKIDPSSWKDTPGSDRIIEVLLQDDPRPVYILAWGGGNTAAKAFQKLKEKYPDQYRRAASKAVMYNIWYQDGAGSYIETFHPEVTMLLSHNFSGSWDYGSQLYTKDFVRDLLHENSGPLAKHYVQNNISEGDSPSFFNFIENGLRSYEDPSFGGWGGQFHRHEGYENVYLDNGKTTYLSWIEYVLRDFEMRLKWCTADSRDKANHYPVITVDGPLERTVRSGEKVVLTATAEDEDALDADALWDRFGAVMSQGDPTMTKETLLKRAASLNLKPTCTWWQYREAGTYPGFVTLQHEGDKVSFTAPKVDSPVTVHMIYEAKDWGRPALSAFARIVITIVP